MTDRAILRDLVAAPLVSGFAAGKDDQTDSGGDAVPQLRPTNILPDGEISFEGAKYIPRNRVEDSDVLADGEVLFNNTNSTAWVGKSALFRQGDHPSVVCSNHVTRIRPNTRVNGAFLVEVLNLMQRNGYFGRLATNFNNQAGINGDTLGDVEIPLGPAERRPKLLAALDAARAARRRKLEEAEFLLGGLDAFVLETLDLTVPPPDGRTVYAVRLRDARQRFDPDYNSPGFRALRSKIEGGKFPSESVGNLFHPIVSGFAAGGNDQTDDSSVGVPHIRPLNISNTAELHFDGTKMVPRSAVEPGDFLKQGEILFNNTNSTAWVGKTVVFDADRECACSNHITRLTLIDKKHSPYYFAALFNALRGLGYFGLLSTNFNNQAGVNVDTLKAVRFPLPDPATQKKIAAEVSRRRAAARRLRADAAQLWDDAKRRFEVELLGPRN